MKNIFLTFDDGPNEPYTSQILGILKKFNVKASFFVCGKNVEYYPRIARKIVEDGHVIGNHTYSHSYIPAILGLELGEIQKTDRIIFQVCGVRTRYVRLPWGHARPWLRRDLTTHGYKLFLWHVDARDWKRPDFHLLAKRITQKSKPNSIILLHNGEKTRHGADRSQTVRALPIILTNLKKEGYAFETIDILGKKK